MLEGFDVKAALTALKTDGEHSAKSASSIAVESDMVKACRKGRNFRQESLKVLEAKFTFYQAQYKACLAVRRDSEYWTFSQTTLEHEALALARLEAKLRDLRCKIEQVQNADTT